MDAVSIVGILKVVFGPAIKASRLVGKEAHLLYFGWRDREPPVNQVTALRNARSALGGSIRAVIPFRSLNSKSQFLAVARTHHDEDFHVKIHILEQVGAAYLRRWESEEMWGSFDSDSLQVVDLDKDGIKEIAFESSSFGSGAGSKNLYVYSLQNDQLFEVEEFYDYSNAATPDVFLVKMDAGTNERFREGLIDYATSRGFLQGNEPIDYDDPKFAVLRWHKENGDKRIGKVKVHLYSGSPVYPEDCTHRTLDAGDLIWTAFFKGPLFAFVKSKDRHFIPYSPQWVYEWVKSLADDGRQLWFVCHCVPGLSSFDYKVNVLKHYCGYAGYPLPDADEITYEDGALGFQTWDPSLGPGDVIDIESLDALMECRPFCMLQESHLPDECDSKRYREELDTMLEKLQQ
jgi:hypothetical protein